MKSYPAPLMALLSGERCRMFLLVSLGLPATGVEVAFGEDTLAFGEDTLVFGGASLSSAIRKTDCDVDLTVAGLVFESSTIRIGEVMQNAGLSVDSLDLILSTVDQSMVQTVLSQDVRGYQATIDLVAIDDDFKVVGTAPLWRGVIDDWDMNEQEITITVLNELFLWSKKTLRKCQASCRWEFRGAECAYAGAETWCDQSYERCLALSNTDQFGGFRFLPAIMERDIYWGRSPNLGDK